MPDDDMTVTEAAARLGVTTHAVRFHIRAGNLAARRVGPIYLIRRDDVEAYRILMQDQRRPGVPRGTGKNKH